MCSNKPLEQERRSGLVFGHKHERSLNLDMSKIYFLYIYKRYAKSEILAFFYIYLRHETSRNSWQNIYFLFNIFIF